METKLNIKSKAVLLLIFAVVATISCHTPKEIAHQSGQLDTLNDYKGTSGYFVDKRDGKRYKWVRIGEQIWMAENLAYKADSGCVAFKHKERKANKYGYYYSWETAMQSCPKGWHLPSEEEFLKMQEIVGEFGLNAYDSLKINDDYGLNFINAGCYDLELNKFRKTNIYRLVTISFWSSTHGLSYHKDLNVISTFSINRFRKTVGRAIACENTYYSVRCIKD